MYLLTPQVQKYNLQLFTCAKCANSRIHTTKKYLFMNSHNQSKKNCRAINTFTQLKRKTMCSKSKMIFAMIGIFFSVNSLKAQTENTGIMPSATAHLKSSSPNTFIEAISILAKGDPILTEKSIKEIISLKQTGNLQLISEEAYDLLPENRRKYFTNSRQMQEIIEKQKQ